jgi:aspartyl protease family protein
MSLHDRDWYRKALLEKEQFVKRKSALPRFPFQRATGNPVNPVKTGLLPMLLFWAVVMGLLYWGMTQYLKPKQVRVLSHGELVIERARDGHFYANGQVQGKDVVFLVDTGASLVSISDELARSAHLQGGKPAVFQTANGARSGRIVEGVTITVGPISVSNLKIGVGLSLKEPNQALLGQSFLSKFNVTLSKDQMVLIPR